MSENPSSQTPTIDGSMTPVLETAIHGTDIGLSIGEVPPAIVPGHSETVNEDSVCGHPGQSPLSSPSPTPDSNMECISMTTPNAPSSVPASESEHATYDDLTWVDEPWIPKGPGNITTGTKGSGKPQRPIKGNGGNKNTEDIDIVEEE